MTPWEEFKFTMRKLLWVAAVTGVSHALYYVLDVHKRYVWCLLEGKGRNGANLFNIYFQVGISPNV